MAALHAAPAPLLGYRQKRLRVSTLVRDHKPLVNEPVLPTRLAFCDSVSTPNLDLQPRQVCLCPIVARLKPNHGFEFVERLLPVFLFHQASPIIETSRGIGWIQSGSDAKFVPRRVELSGGDQLTSQL